MFMFRVTNAPTEQRARRICLLILMVINVALLLTFGTLVFQWRAKRLRALEPVETRICVPSLEFYNKTCPNSTDCIEEKTCCGTASLILQGMLPKELSATFEKNYPSRLLSDADLECNKTTRRVCSAKLSGVDIWQGKIPIDPICHWQDVKLDHLVYRDGKVFIKETGHYFIQSQVKMSPPKVAKHSSNATETPENDRNAPITYRHFIQHFSHRTQRTGTILENTEHHCRKLGHSFNTTLSTGAVFWLERRDHVFVMTSHPEHLVPCPHDNRFALFLIK